VVEAMGWIRTFRDPVLIDKIVDEAIEENPKLVQKFVKTKSQKHLDAIMQVRGPKTLPNLTPVL
jgi:hypothetical protein